MAESLSVGNNSTVYSFKVPLLDYVLYFMWGWFGGKELTNYVYKCVKKAVWPALGEHSPCCYKSHAWGLFSSNLLIFRILFHPVKTLILIKRETEIKHGRESLAHEMWGLFPIFSLFLDTKKMKPFSCHVLCFNKLYITFIQRPQPLAIQFSVY